MTGLIGSGKSLAASIFKELGADVIDTDIIAKYITASNGIAIPKLKNTFGNEFITESGELNRALMRDLVFTNNEARYKLEDILHPIIFDEVIRLVDECTHNYIILMVPLLFRSLKYINLIHRSIFVDSKEDLIIKRVISRSSLQEVEVKRILEAQMTPSIQLMLSDDCITNNTDILNLRNQVIKLNDYYKTIFADDNK